MTSRAADAIAETRAKSGLGDRTALRICASSKVNGDSGYQLRFAEEPLPDDEVISTAGATVFIASNIADRLATFVLDAEKKPNGSKFVLKHSPPS